MLQLVAFTLLASAFAENWAVLVAGSNGFSNYRHQSDIFRTYKILTKNGFDTTKIITMCFDDIASSKSNPFPGKVFNVPDGPDVYIGSSNIDYKGNNVTAAKFYAVLLGDQEKAGGKVLESTSDDNVFIFYNDHGSSGLICFPVGGNAYADELNTVFKQMYEKKMYQNLLFYVEACYSGSMFKKYLPTNIGIYVVTAANETESSWAEYCGIAKYKTCLSNEFSQRWEQHSDVNDLSKVTVAQQFQFVRDAVKRSNVKEYGQNSIKDLKLSQFQAGPEKRIEEEMWISPPTSQESGKWRTVRQEDAHITYLKTAAGLDQFGSDAVEYHREVQLKKKEEARREVIAKFFGLSYPDPNYADVDADIDMDLYRRAIIAYETICGKMNEFTMWSHTVILSRAVANKSLNVANFSAYEVMLRSVA